jgi:HipA-like C-terminal domain
MSSSTPPGAVAPASRIEISVPTNFVRVAKKGVTWGLPRSFGRYFVDQEIQGLLGNATKWIIRSDDPAKPRFMVKYPQKFGEQETFTEFFINQLGRVLGFDMAHSGLIRLDGTLAFLTQVFTTTHNLRHGSLIIEDYFKEERALERVRRREEQAFYSIDFVVELLRTFVGADFNQILPKFIQMLVFDALIGSMDRHVQNWGVLETIQEPARYQFAPIFDSARALLWSKDEPGVALLYNNPAAFRAHLDRARPCLGPKRYHLTQNRCNHFAFVANLMELYPGPADAAIQKVPENVAQKTNRLLRAFPFGTAFSNQRKQLIVKILADRAQILRTIAKGGAP